MLDVPEFDRWRRSARGARQAAQGTASAGSHHWACFLAEQAAQLAVKAFLHGAGVGAWGHDLVELDRRLAEVTGQALDASVRDACIRLSRHYIPARYPDAHPGGAPEDHYAATDAKQALDDTDLVIAAVDRLWREGQSR